MTLCDGQGDKPKPDLRNAFSQEEYGVDRENTHQAKPA